MMNRGEAWIGVFSDYAGKKMPQGSMITHHTPEEIAKIVAVLSVNTTTGLIIFAVATHSSNQTQLMIHASDILSLEMPTTALT
jgi:hypothetical protein